MCFQYCLGCTGIPSLTLFLFKKILFSISMWLDAILFPSLGNQLALIGHLLFTKPRSRPWRGRRRRTMKEGQRGVPQTWKWVIGTSAAGSLAGEAPGKCWWQTGGTQLCWNSYVAADPHKSPSVCWGAGLYLYWALCLQVADNL